ncbi:MAG TPA: alpha/beta hydrolase [Gemmatimonadaceae bacterium]|jgi:pimeloyl-ACP methyl ester carboxylesterase|nr:alpha/beta hydrolase [Gemmatimonadaceae bacterium]
MSLKRAALLTLVALGAALGCDRDVSDAPFSITRVTDAFARNASPRGTKPIVVLVHGAFADATTFQELISLLQERHYPTVAVQNTLTSLDADIVTTKRLIDAQTGPVIVLGHSYGGAVITGAAAGNPNVKALVYVAAFAPDANEPVGGLQGNYPPTLLASALVPDAAGFLYVDTTKFREVFAQDVAPRLTRIVAATQKPIIASVFGASTPQVAWRSIPAWYMVATEDHAINPALERFYAKRMNAHTTEVKSSHVMYISHPADVMRVIEEAAIATQP